MNFARVGRILAGAGPGRLHLRPHVENRAQPRRVADAAAVRMGIVERGAVFAVLVEEELVRVECRELAGEQLAEGAVEGQMLVRIGHVLDRRQQEGDACRAARRRQHHEGHVLLGALRPEPRGVDPARHPRRHGPFEIDVPAGVVEVVVVEVDGAVFMRRVAPAHLFPGKIPAGHAARRQIDDLAVAVMGRAVGNRDRGDVAGKIPGAEDVGRERRGDRLVPHALDSEAIERAADQAGRIDLAVVEGIHQRAALGAPPEDAGHDDRRAAAGGGRPQRAPGGPAVAGARIGQERLLMDPDPAAVRVVAGGGEIPVAIQQRLADRDGLDRAVRHGEPERDGARRVDDQREAGPAARVPLAHDALFALARRGRPDHRLHGEAAEGLQQRPALHQGVGARVDGLPAPLVALAHRRADRPFLEARAGGRVVGADQAHDVRPIGRMLAVDHERDGLARPDAEPVGIARDRQHAAPPRCAVLPPRA